MPTTDEVLRIALALHQAGRLPEAEQLYGQILADRPQDSVAWHHSGVVAYQTGSLELAVERIGRALQLMPDYAEAYTDLGTVYQKLGKHDQAAECHRRALKLQPELAAAHFNLGNALKEQAQLDEAVNCYRRALQLRPNYWKAFTNLGIVLRKQAKLDEAVACLSRGLELKPDDPEALNNLGNAYRDQGMADDAEGCYRRALDLKPDFAEAQSNLGIACQSRGNYEEAAIRYHKSLDLKPGFAEAHWNQSMLMLLAGDFENGWREYEWRWRTDPPDSRRFFQPVWGGQPLAGQTILLHAEQGFGDTIQFIRYAALVKDLGATVVVECQRPLEKLLARCPSIDRLVAGGCELPPFDFHLPLLSLPGIFKTSLDTIPANVPYLFADPALIALWREKLGKLHGVRIGVNWRGRPGKGDFRKRDIPLNCFRMLMVSARRRTSCGM